MDYKTSIRLLFEAALLEGERRMQMKRDSDKYPGGPAEKQLYQAKPGQLTPDGKKQLQKASADYVAATKKARAEKKVESIRNNFNNILSEMIKPEGKPKPKPIDPKKAAMDEKRKKFVPGGGINPKHAPKGGHIKETSADYVAATKKVESIRNNFSLILKESDHVTYGDVYKRFDDDPSQYPRTIDTPTEVGIKRGLKSEFPNVVAKATAMDNKQKERYARVKKEMEERRAARQAGERNTPRPLSTKLRRLGQVAVGRAAKRLGLRPKN